MNLQQLIIQKAQESFNITAIKPYQMLVMLRVLEFEQNNKRNRQLVVFPTGFGKSLCFLLPATIIDGVTVIVFPLLSLLSDQKNKLDKLKIPNVVIKGGQTKEERREIYQKLKNKECKIIVTTPESLSNINVLRVLQTINVRLLVVDEAHVVCQWGDEFRPAYLNLKEIARVLQPRQLLAFTATANNEILQRLNESLFSGIKPHIIRADIDRSNLTYNSVRTLNKLQSLIDILKHCQKPAIIFCSTRLDTVNTSIKLALALNSKQVKFYHAGLNPKERAFIESWFLNSEDGILVSTSAYGMGVDKKSIRTTIHMDIPKSADEFLQESGRAGRDGKPSMSYTLVPLNSEQTELYKVFNSTTKCKREALLNLMDQKMLSCNGCDVCEGRVFETPIEMKKIINFVRHYPLRFSPAQLARVLWGRYQLYQFDDTYSSLSYFSSWEIDNLQEAIENLVESKWLRVTKKGKKLYCLHYLKKITFAPIKK